MTEYVDYDKLYFNDTPITNQKHIKLNAKYGLIKVKVENSNNLSNFTKINIDKSNNKLPMVQAMSKIPGNNNKNIMGTFYKDSSNTNYNKLKNKNIWITKNVFAEPQGRQAFLNNIKKGMKLKPVKKNSNPSQNSIFKVPPTMINKNITIEYTDDNLKGEGISINNPESNTTKNSVKTFINKFIEDYFKLNNTAKEVLKTGKGIDDEQTFKASIIKQLEKQKINNISAYNQNKLVVEYDNGSW
jgi:hypothetical protein